MNSDTPKDVDDESASAKDQPKTGQGRETFDADRAKTARDTLDKSRKTADEQPDDPDPS